MHDVGLSCADCLPGYYTSVAGQSECRACPVGTYMNHRCACPLQRRRLTIRACGSAGTECSLCAAGRAQSQPAATGCTACRAGTFAASGSALCAPCAPGAMHRALAARPPAVDARCCPPGTYQSAASQAACLECPAGTAMPSPASALPPLPRFHALSTFFPFVQGASQCNDCLPGFYSEGAASVCDPCPLGKFAMMPQQVGRRAADPPTHPSIRAWPQISCAFCPSLSSSFNGTTCQCPVGYYLVINRWRGTVPDLECKRACAGAAGWPAHDSRGARRDAQTAPPARTAHRAAPSSPVCCLSEAITRVRWHNEAGCRHLPGTRVRSAGVE
jgi:hypothetical protein